MPMPNDLPAVVCDFYTQGPDGCDGDAYRQCERCSAHVCELHSTCGICPECWPEEQEGAA